MASALRAWAINRRGINAVRNLRYGPRTRLVRGSILYNNQINARALIGQSAMVYCSGKNRAKISRVLPNIPRGLLPL